MKIGKSNLVWEFYRIKNKTAADKIIKGIIQTAESILYAEQFQQEEFLYQRHRRAIYKHFKNLRKNFRWYRNSTDFGFPPESLQNESVINSFPYFPKDLNPEPPVKTSTSHQPKS